MSQLKIALPLAISCLVIVAVAAVGLGANRVAGSAPVCTSHHVTIAHNQVAPYNTHARVCDQLTITNADQRIRLIAFGEHDHHQTYSGVKEKALGPRQSLTLTLATPGRIVFHDHLQDEVQGLLVVVK
jgi:hypothetical protein